MGPSTFSQTLLKEKFITLTRNYLESTSVLVIPSLTDKSVLGCDGGCATTERRLTHPFSMFLSSKLQLPHKATSSTLQNYSYAQIQPRTESNTFNMPPSFYHLPSSPNTKVIDRFSLLDEIPLSPTTKLKIEQDPSGLVPLWPLLAHLLSPSTNPPITTMGLLTSLLDTISTTIRGTAFPAGNYSLLRECIVSYFGSEDVFFERIWPKVVHLALKMPRLFPDGRIPILGRGNEDGRVERVRLTRRQVGCLVVYQFLRALEVPRWKVKGKDGGWGGEGGEEELHDFGVWYDGGRQRHVEVVRGYLRGLMRYFERVVCGFGTEEGEEEGGQGDGWVVEYTLCSVEEETFKEAVEKEGCRLGEVEVQVVERYDLLPESVGIPGGAAVVSANRHIGFGQSATQEEVHVGSSPEACPAVLITPPLGDNQVLVVRGAQAMVNITGQRRDIRVEEMPVPEGGDTVWRGRTMLFMDALELDMAEPGESLPDLLPGNLDREVRKAYTAFSSGQYREICTGLWGCGAFCGDPGVKMLLLWLAASLAGTKLVVICDITGRDFAEEFQSFMEKARGVLRDTVELYQLLYRAPGTLVKRKTLDWYTGRLEPKQW